MLDAFRSFQAVYSISIYEGAIIVFGLNKQVIFSWHSHQRFQRRDFIFTFPPSRLAEFINYRSNLVSHKSVASRSTSPSTPISVNKYKYEKPPYPRYFSEVNFFEIPPREKSKGFFFFFIFLFLQGLYSFLDGGQFRQYFLI
jgi:hypothetical protein